MQPAPGIGAALFSIGGVACTLSVTRRRFDFDLDDIDNLANHAATDVVAPPEHYRQFLALDRSAQSEPSTPSRLRVG